MIISLDDAIDHIRDVEPEEYDILAIYVDAAESHIMAYLNRPVPWKVQETNSEGEPVLDSEGEPVMVDAPIPGSLKGAALLLAEDSFGNRSAATKETLHENPAVVRLLNPYRVYPGL